MIRAGCRPFLFLKFSDFFATRRHSRFRLPIDGSGAVGAHSTRSRISVIEIRLPVQCETREAYREDGKVHERVPTNP
jgi:hypothetical protein